MSIAVVVICVDPAAPGAIQFTGCATGYAGTATLTYVDPVVDNAVPDDLNGYFMAGFCIPLSIYIVSRLIGEIISFVRRH